MFGSVGTATVLVLFALTGLACMARTAWCGDTQGRVSAGIHLLASLVMVLMLYSWPANVLTMAVLVGFVIAAGWYAYRAWSLHGGRARTRPIDHEAGEKHHESVGSLAYHAAMMVAMAWMSLSMTSHDMAAMPMEPAHGIAASAHGLETWLPSLVSAALVAAAAWFVVRLGRHLRAAVPWDRRAAAATLDTGIDLGMAAGMAGMIASMMI